MKDTFRQRRLKELATLYDTDLIMNLVEEHGSPLFVIDEQAVIKQYRAFKKAIPRATPYFAVKSCPSPELLAIYKEHAVHLDVATKGELEILGKLNYPPKLMIHTHPNKKMDDIASAYSFGIRSFVFDSIEELAKFEEYKETVNLSLRLSFPNKYAAIDLSYKFGALPEEALEIMKLALSKGFKVPCICFHVGSQLNNVSVLVDAIQKTSAFCTLVQKELSHTFSIVDIGGGFPAPYTNDVTSIEDFAISLNPLLDNLFPDCEIRSEPGRYLANPVAFVLSSVVTASLRNGANWLYVDDGVYGSFANIMYTNTKYNFYSLKELSGAKLSARFTIGGPTCDSLDVLAENIMLPEMQKGDIFIIPDIGAYSWALASNFNSLPKPKIIVI